MSLRLGLLTESRQGKASQYTWQNVCIVPSEHAGLVRIAAVLRNVYVGFFVPDYTAYAEMLSLLQNVGAIEPLHYVGSLNYLNLTFPQFTPIPVLLNEEDNYTVHPDQVAEQVERGVSAILTSNPRNPVGSSVRNPELAELQDICRDRATLVIDESYNGYNYSSNCDGTVVSAAENVEDVDEDDVLIIDGLTHRFRLPGWGISWIIGPRVR
jgi:DNA-binding transcriptional MocR family regulator